MSVFFLRTLIHNLHSHITITLPLHNPYISTTKDTKTHIIVTKNPINTIKDNITPYWSTNHSSCLNSHSPWSPQPTWVAVGCTPCPREWCDAGDWSRPRTPIRQVPRRGWWGWAAVPPLPTPSSGDIVPAASTPSPSSVSPVAAPLAGWGSIRPRVVAVLMGRWRNSLELSWYFCDALYFSYSHAVVAG